LGILGVNCRPRLKEQMEYCIQHPEEMNKVAKIKSQVAEVKDIMMENIERVCFYLTSNAGLQGLLLKIVDKSTGSPFLLTSTMEAEMLPTFLQ
jgi:hypothetical protein